MASDALSLLFKIKADSSDAQRDIKSLRNIFDSEVRGIETSGTSSFNKLGQSIGLTTTQMSGLAKAAPLAGAAIAAIAGTIGIFAGAAIAAGNAVFDLAKQTADYGSKINDASLKTGLSTETLSGLDLQLKQSGTSMEAFTTAIFMMQKNLEAMADGSKKGTEALQKIGLKPGQLGDTEAVLRQVLKHLAAMPDESARNAEGARLMGRSYKELAVFVADTGGNIDAAIDKAREMGLVMSGEAARAADEFGDKLDELASRALGMGRVIGMQVIPMITEAIDKLNEMVRTSPDIVDYAGRAIKATIQDWIIVPLHAANAAVILLRNSFGTLGSIVNSKLAQVKDVMAKQAAAFSGPDIVGGAPTPRDFGGGGGGGGGGGRRKAAGQSDEERALQFLKQLEDQQNRTTATTELARVSLKLLEKGYNGLSDATREAIFRTAQAIDTDKAATKAKDLLAKAVESVAKFTEDQNRELNESRGIMPTAMDAVDAFLKSFEKLGEGKMHVLPLVEILMRLRALAISGAEAVIRLQAAVAASGAIPGAGPGGATLDPNAPAGGLGTAPGGGLIDWAGLTTTIADTLGTSTGVIQEFGNMATSTFRNIAQGVGAAYEAFVLFGTGGEGIKKFAARMIASLAAMAATNAAFELAMGLAKLALNYFFPSPNLAKAAATHFAAAAAFGLVAGVAGIGGRLLAGNSFAPAGGGGGGGTGAGAQGGQAGGTQGRETNIIERERNRPQPIEVVVRMNVQSDPNHIIDAFVEDHRNDGRTRKLVMGMVEA